LSDVCVEWAGGTVTQAPVRIPPVFAGGRVLIYGFVKGGRPSNVRLTATGPSGRLAFEVPVPDAAAGSHHTVATLAARARIRELEEGGEWLSGRGSQQKDRKPMGASQEIIALSLRYGLISRETSFVAIERRDTPVTGDVKLRKVPIALTTGWGGGVQQQPFGFARRRAQMWNRPVPDAVAMPRCAAPAFDWISSRASSGLVDCVKLESVREADGAVTRYFQSAAPPVTPRSRSRARAAAARTMHTLVLLQSSDGSWDLTDELASIVGRDLVELRSAVQAATGPEAEVLRAWATALALAWLARNAAEAADEWRLLADKALKWINDVSAVPPGGSTWIGRATALIAN
jgi:hypothetical protein